MGGGPALPTPSTPGYTSFRGHTSCDCLAAWLPVYEDLLRIKGLIVDSIDIIQLTGDYEASGGTHSKGGAEDDRQTSDEEIAVAREMGAWATWRRTPAQGFSLHKHGVLAGCPHNSPARYQLDAVRAGFNGLGAGGRSGPDYHPAPKTYRTWSQGIAWAKTEIARLEEERLMALADTLLAELRAFRAEEADRYKVYTARYQDEQGDLASVQATVDAARSEEAARYVDFVARANAIKAVVDNIDTADVPAVLAKLGELKTQADSLAAAVAAIPKA